MANPASTFTPGFKRLQQPAESLDSITCIAMITGKPIADILKTAVEKFKLRPSNGPYFFDQARLQVLLAAHGFVAGNYLEIADLNDVPDLALVWQETDAEMEMGRHLLFHRMSDPANPKQSVMYVIDPAPQTNPAMCIRTELADLELSYFISVHPMKPTGK